jgi:diguanylate cyclase (GGDEF)-like protein/PAS domain S-box-containing protein/putative nucleotidyltransferase with HDIG domain
MPEQSTSTAKRLRLAVVEEGQAVSAMLTTLLSSSHSDAISLERGVLLDAAVQLCQARQADAVLVELTPGHGRGAEFMATLKAHAGAVPFVVIATAQDETTAVGLLELGIQDYLLKGCFDAAALEHAVNAAVARQKAIGEHEQKAEELRRSEERYALAVRGSKDGLWDWNLLTDEVYFSPRWKAILGYAKNEIGNAPTEWFKRIHQEDIEAVRNDIAAHLQGHTPHFENEHRLQHKDGVYRWILSRGTAVRSIDGKAIRIAGSLSDITERKEGEKNLKRALSDLKFALASEKVLLDELDRRNKELVALSITDGLTGLYNHRFIQERFDFEFKRVRRYDGTLSCMLADIDHFKRINDTYGHQFGDLVLREIATILRTQSREVDICGRYGGEEFMIITNQPIEGAMRYATKLHTAIENHIFKSAEHSVHVTVSIGIADWRKSILTKQELIERADTALYQAKEDGRNLIRVWKEIEKRPEEHAIDRGGIEELKEKFDDLSNKVRATYIESTYALLRAVDARDHYTEVHSQNVSKYALETGRLMGLQEEELEVLRYAGLLHDIGKIGVSQEILTKKSSLTEREFEVLKKHPSIGANILKDVRFLEKEIPIILHHHERYDGTGYPQGLKGREIPLGARIMAVADAFDAMTTDREFKRKLALAEAVAELKRGSGSQFAPEIVEIFVTFIETKIAADGHFYSVQA